MPDIELVERYVPLPADLTDQHLSPPVPSNGDNADMLEWCIASAGSARMLNDQMDAIRELERE